MRLLLSHGAAILLLTALLSFQNREATAAPTKQPGASPGNEQEQDKAFPETLVNIIGELKPSKTPVCLPTWLPMEEIASTPYARENLFVDISDGSFTDGYAVLFCASAGAGAMRPFALEAGKGHVNPSEEEISLTPECTGYFHVKGSFMSLEWLENGYCYKIWLLNFPGKETRQLLTKVAQSMRSVSKRQMSKESKNQNRLKKAYERKSAETQNTSNTQP